MISWPSDDAVSLRACKNSPSGVKMVKKRLFTSIMIPFFTFPTPLLNNLLNKHNPQLE